MAKSSGDGKPQSNPENLDKVRELLFGPQLSELDAKLAQLRADVDAKTKELAESLAHQTAAARGQSEADIARLEQRLTETRDALDASAKDFESRLGAESKRSTHALETSTQELTTLLDARVTALAATTADSAEKTRQNVTNVEARLNDEKLDRRALAELLRSVAAELDGGG